MKRREAINYKNSQFQNFNEERQKKGAEENSVMTDSHLSTGHNCTAAKRSQLMGNVYCDRSDTLAVRG